MVDGLCGRVPIHSSRYRFAHPQIAYPTRMPPTTHLQTDSLASLELVSTGVQADFQAHYPFFIPYHPPRTKPVKPITQVEGAIIRFDDAQTAYKIGVRAVGAGVEAEMHRADEGEGSMEWGRGEGEHIGALFQRPLIHHTGWTSKHWTAQVGGGIAGVVGVGGRQGVGRGRNRL